jgi:hypothetical protein
MSLVDYLGIKKFGKGVASAIRVGTGEVQRDIQVQQNADASVQKLVYAAKQEKDQEKKRRLLEMAQKLGGQNIAPEQIDPGLKLTNKEILGSAANVVLNVATPGAFKGGKAAVVAKNAAMGAGYGAASGLEKNRSASGIAGSTIGGGIIGTFTGLFGLGAKAAKDFVGVKTPEWIMNKAVKPALQDLKKNVKYGTATLGKELLDEGVKGGPKKLLQIADDKLNSLEDELQRVLTQPGLDEARITRQQIRPYLKELVETKKGVPGLGGEAQRIEGIWKSMPEAMTLQEANQMKRRIYQELRDVSYKMDAKLGTRAAALKQIAKGLKTEIENTVGGTVVSDINKKLSIYGRLENAMVDQLARNMRNNGISLTDAILLAGGDTTSVLALLRHIGQGAETHIAQGMSKVSKVGTGAVGKTVKNVMKRAALNAP